MRATARNWSDAKAIGRNEVIELRNVDGQIRIARKARYHDDWDPPIEPYDRYGPGVVVTDDAIDDCGHVTDDERHR
jgi:hypothetical protein